MKQGIVLGLTGQSGSGKSTVCRLLRRRCPESLAFIDCDQVARLVVEPGTPCLEVLEKVFSPYAGGSLLRDDGSLDRRRLGSVVFGDRELLRRLNAIIFPYILEEIDRQVRTLLPENRLVVLDAPTLFESGADSRCRYIASVIAPYRLRVQRICRRDGLSETEAAKRLASQHDDGYYIRRSDFILHNSRDERYIQEQLDRMLFRLGLISGRDWHTSMLRRRKRHP